MTLEEFKEQLENIQTMRCETQTLEIKTAAKGCPKKLFDSLSSFSNQDEGGIIIFGVDEDQNYEEVGVYDPQDLQKQVNNQCLQMQPVVRPLFTVLEKDGRTFVAAEIPGMDLADRPCHYRGVGRIKGSYIRIGDSDEPMTEYEIYSYEAFRKKYQDDVRTISRATFSALELKELQEYVYRLKAGKPNLSRLSDEKIYELMSVTRDHEITLSAIMLFCPYPQAYFPQLCIIATVVPGTEQGAVGEHGERFLDNQRIEGNIPQMLEGALRFVRRNVRKRTIINAETGRREDRTDYPMDAIREAVLNALVHRDYSIHTEGMPIQLIMFEDRVEIHNPGGLYGRIRIDQLGKIQPDTRNPVLATALEVLEITENRYSGIPTIREKMDEYGLLEPEFADERGNFVVRFFKQMKEEHSDFIQNEEEEATKDILIFCQTPRTRKEICEYLGLKSVSYVMQKYMNPLIEQGRIQMSIPEKPQSPKQLFIAVDHVNP